MKLNSSPSVSKGSVFGCLSFVLRRIICPKSLATHPFDQFKDFGSFENQNSDSMNPKKSDDPSTPNLVARLMGLESMPNINRSKSTNSMDCRFEETEQIHGNHRRVKTSVSFRETPEYFELEDDDFFVPRSENGKKKAKSDRRRRRRRVERIQIKESDRELLKEERRRPSLKISESDNSEVYVLQMENLSSNFKKGKCLVDAKVETESESENLSPVSVLDNSLFISDHDEEVPTSEEEPRSTSSNPSSDDNNGSSSIGDCREEPNECRQTSLQRKDYHSHQNIEMLNQICKMAELEMANSDWNGKSGLIRNLKNWEGEIGVQLGLQIVDQLVDEVVHQLL